MSPGKQFPAAALGPLAVVAALESEQTIGSADQDDQFLAPVAVEVGGHGILRQLLHGRFGAMELSGHGQFIGIVRIGRPGFVAISRRHPIVDFDARLAGVDHHQLIAAVAVDIERIGASRRAFLANHAHGLPAGEIGAGDHGGQQARNQGPDGLWR